MHDLDRTILDEEEYGYDDEFDYDDEYDVGYDDEFDLDDDEELDDDYEDEFEDMEDMYDDEYDEEMWEEYDDEYDDEIAYEDSWDEEDELGLATELMDVSDDEELDEFLGSLIKKVGGAAKRIFRRGRKVTRSPLVRKQWKAHQKRKKMLLPIFKKIFGNYFGGGGGSMGSSFFEVNLDGLSPDEQRYEVAKKSTKFMSAALKHLPKNPNIPAKVAVKRALKKAASSHMPQLLRSARKKQRRKLRRWTKQGRAGRWMRSRDGKRIILLGV